ALCCKHEYIHIFFFFSSRRRHTRSKRDWSSDVCSSDLSYIGIRQKKEYLSNGYLYFSIHIINIVDFVARFMYYNSCWYFYGGVAQLARACGSYPQGCEFNSLRRYL